MLKVGFIGLGAISHEHVLGYQGCPDAEIVAVCDLESLRCEAWLRRYNLTHARSYIDYQEMLAQEELDLVEILTPHHLHAEHAIAAAGAKVRGISLQKPMATRLVDCDRIIEACRKHGSMLKVYENYIFYPVYVKAKVLVDQGLLGELISIRVHTMVGLAEGTPWPWCLRPDSWRLNLKTGGCGPLVGDDGFHKFSLVRWFMDREIEKISAWIDPDTPLDAPAMIRTKFRSRGNEGPKYAQLDFSLMPRMSLPGDFWFDDFVQIVGERGIMWINQCQGAGNREMFHGVEMSNSPLFPPIAVFLGGRVNTYLEGMTPSQRNWSTSFVAGTRHFIKMLQEGGDPVYTGEQGKEITRYGMAAIVSAQEGGDIQIDQITSDAERERRFEIRTNFCNP